MFQNERWRLPGAGSLLERPAIAGDGLAAPVGLIVRPAAALRIETEQQQQLLPQTVSRASDRKQRWGFLEQGAALLLRPLAVQADSDPGRQPGEKVNTGAGGLGGRR